MYRCRELTHLSLFSGIGGLDIAAEMAGFKTVGQCEYGDYQTRVLEQHWPEVERWKDIHELSADEFIRRTGRKEVTVISGGFPCQPHSIAGKRKASSDERDLWPEFRRVISEIRPKWVVAENVRGLLSSESGRFFRGILRDFSDMGYDVGWCCYRAADVGAIHSRERIGIIAHSRIERIMDCKIKEYTAKWDKTFNETDYDIDREQLQRMPEESLPGEQRIKEFQSYRNVEEWTRRCNVFEPKLLRDYNGFPGCVDRIKSLGNAVMPQQFYPIFKVIADIEKYIFPCSCS